MSLIVDPSRNLYQLHRGDGGALLPLRFTFTRGDGSALDVSGGSFLFTLKRNLDDDIADAIFQLSNPAVNGVDLSQGAAGIADVIFPTAYTEALATGDYACDLQATLATGRLSKVGTLRVLKDVTTPGAVSNPGVVLQEFSGNIFVSGGEIYLRDKAIPTNFWRLSIINGVFDKYGPLTSIPV